MFNSPILLWLLANKGQAATGYTRDALEGASSSQLNVLSMLNPNYASSDEDFIEGLYTSLLGRASDAEGKDYWLSLSKSGVSRYELLESFLKGASASSDAAAANASVANFIENIYQKYLGRPSDEAGKAFWMGVAGSGTSLADVLESMLQAAGANGEAGYANALGKAITDVYENLLGRTPSAEEVASAKNASAANITATSQNADTLGTSAGSGENPSAPSTPSTPVTLSKPSSPSGDNSSSSTPSKPAQPEQPKMIDLEYDSSNQTIDLSSGSYNGVNFKPNFDYLIIRNITDTFEVINGSNGMIAFATTDETNIQRGADANGIISVYLGGEGKGLGDESFHLTSDDDWLTNASNIVVSTKELIAADKELLQKLDKAGVKIDFQFIQNGHECKFDINGNIAEDSDNYALFTGVTGISSAISISASVGTLSTDYFTMLFTEGRDTVDLKNAKGKDSNALVFAYGFDKDADKFVMPSNAEVADGKATFDEAIDGWITGMTIAKGIAEIQSKVAVQADSILKALNKGFGANKAALSKVATQGDDYLLFYTGASEEIESDDFIIRFVGSLELDFEKLAIDSNHIATIA